MGEEIVTEKTEYRITPQKKKVEMEISIELHIKRGCKGVGLDRFYCISLDPISFCRKIKMEYCFIYRIRSTMQCIQIDQRTAKENR